MLAKTVIITAPSATGLQTISGIGFQGKLALVQGMNRAGAATGAGAGWMFGAAVSAASQWVALGRSDDASAAGNSGSRRNDAFIIVSNVAGTATEVADFDSWTSDGFKINWTSTTAAGRQFIVTVLGGSDFEAALGQATTPAGASSQSITGLSFQPNALLLFDCRLNNVNTGTSTFWRPAFGFFDSARNGGGWAGNTWDAADPTVTSRVQSTSAFTGTASTDGARDRTATLTSYNSDGFTLDWVFNTVGATDFQWVAMSVPSAVKSQVAARTSIGDTVVSGLGHTPQLILLGGVESTQTSGTGDPTNNFALGMVGGTGSTEQAVVALEDKDAQGTSDASTKWATGKAINFISANGASPTDDIVANVSAIDYDEFTLHYTVVSGVAVQVIYLSIGTAVVERSSSFTLNSVIKAKRTQTVTLNAWVKAKITSTKTLDAIVKKSVSSTKTLNAIVKASKSGSVTLNAIVRSKISATRTLDSIVKAKVNASATANAIVKKSVSSSFTLDAVSKLSGGGSFTVDADIRNAAMPVWTTPEINISMISLPVLVFTMPQAKGNMFFQIELDKVDTFDSVDYVKYDHSTNNTGWNYWNGSGWVLMPNSGVSNSFSGNEGRLTVQVALSPGTWYRRVRAGTH